MIENSDKRGVNIARFPSRGKWFLSQVKYSKPVRFYSETTTLRQKNLKIIIGLLGGPGSGKSFVARLFAEAGCGVIDADALAREALNEPEVIDQLQNWWGDDVIDAQGQVDRAAVGRIVFEQPESKQKLEALIHPRVHRGRGKLREQFMADSQIVAIVEDTPLLLESGLVDQMDKLVFVEAPWAVRLARVASRGWDAAQLKQRDDNQMALDIKRNAADDVIHNAGDERETRRQVRQLLADYQSG